MNGIEGLGEAVSGGMLARAVEPKAGEVGADGHTHESACLNCGTALVGDYCHACGQHGHIHRTLGAFGHDLLHGVLHFEGKTWRTLPMLAWRPGELTRRYIDGERARFVSPLALFLFSVFIMFAVLGKVGGDTNFGDPRVTGDVVGHLSTEQKKLAELVKTRAAASDPATQRQLDKDIAETRDDIATLQKLEQLKPEKIGSMELSADLEWLREPIEHAIENPELAVYKIRTSAYKFSWLLIPLSLPFLWLLFPFSRRFRMYDHLVFVTYSLSFMTMLVVVAVAVGLAGLPAVAGLIAMIPPFHFYRQLKGTYGLTRGGALWRTAALTIFSTIAFTLFALLISMMGVL